MRFCKNWHNISEQEICEICTNPTRDQLILCIVQDYRNILAIENTNLYKGLYHVLGGFISPMESVTPSNLNIETLDSKLNNNSIAEIILAHNATMEGETTAFYLFIKIEPFNIKLSPLPEV